MQLLYHTGKHWSEAVVNFSTLRKARRPYLLLLQLALDANVAIYYHLTAHLYALVSPGRHLPSFSMAYISGGDTQMALGRGRAAGRES